MVLVDTSVWVEHLRTGSQTLTRLLLDGEVVCHPAIIGELACGNLKQRTSVLRLLQSLPSSPVATDVEALELIDARRLHGRGVGWVDIHLLAATLLLDAKLWSEDRRLRAIAASLDVAYQP